MNISYNWLSQFIDIDLSPDQLSELLTDIGLEVGKVHTFQSIPGGLEGLVIGHVKTCERHPDADRLSVTTIDVGGHEDLSIVCGAPNVAAGQKVVVATVGTILYDKEGGSFQIKKAKIRGQASTGMICAEDEIGVGENHDGIMVLPADTVVGTLAKDYFKVETDHIYDVDLTPNRSDATSHYGVARDVLAALRVRQGYSKELCVPMSSDFKVDDQSLTFDVVVENQEACPRYTGVTLSDIKIKPSPAWLKNRLASIGVRSINNVVDITNYVLHELGQPLHAFDADKIPDHKIRVKTLSDGSTFTSLDDVERKLSDQDLMICDGQDNGLCIGGVFGGSGSGVTDTTTRIFLESAHFDPTYIRRTSTRHQLRSDAAKIFEKTSDISRCVMALKRAATLLVDLADAKITSDIVDIQAGPIVNNEITMTLAKLNVMSGYTFTMDQVAVILTAMEINIVSDADQTFVVQVPTDKADVLRDVDLVEEILRIYGYNNIPEQTKIQFSVNSANSSLNYDFKEKLSVILSGLGYHEMMGLSLTNAKHFASLFPIPEEDRVLINNTSNVHLDTMRPLMLVSALEALQHNYNRNQRDIKLFEIGSTYRRNGDKFVESERLSFIITGKANNINWLRPKASGSDIYHVKSTMDAILQAVGGLSYQTTEKEEDYMAYAIDFAQQQKSYGYVGKVDAQVVNGFDIGQDVYYGEIDIQTVMSYSQRRKLVVEPISKYPSVQRDLALLIDQGVTYGDLIKIITSKGGKILQQVDLFDVYQSDDMKAKNKKSYALNLLFSDQGKTLSDKEVDKSIQKIVSTLQRDAGAVLR
ncbi:UNVERIFIED_CONTAM: hypothetical protein GTU68_038800 [Idotea baltica]|nr:hypothetical protein [Idotea baltica]